MRLRIVVFLLAVGFLPALANAEPTVDTYARAERVLDFNLRGRVLNAAISPNWLADGRFWYERKTRAGAEFILVDPAGPNRQPLFDAARMAEAIAGLVPADPAPITTRVESVEQALQSNLRIRLRVDRDSAIDCHVPAYTCRLSPAPAPDRRSLPAPDGTRSVSVRDANLVLRTDGAREERPLTHDGEPSHGYGVLPDFALRGIPWRQGRLQIPPFAVSWSPDGRRLFGVRYDERRVAPYPYLANAPEDGFRPVVHQVRLGLLGDAEQVRDAWFVTDVEAERTRRIDIPEGWNSLTEAGVLGWSASADKVYTAIVRYDRPARLRLVEIDLRAGTVRTILEERSDTRVQLNSYTYNRPAVHVLRSSDEIVWFSERDGWGHLYLLDRRDGRILRRLTSGSWLVRDVVGVDEHRRQLFFTAGGREPGDPYERRLYRISLDGGAPVLLTPESADHAIDGGAGVLLGGRPSRQLSPSARYVIDSYSTVDQPPVSVLRSTRDGQVLLELERADVTALREAGWLAPRRERIKAADGTTDIHATVYLPPDYRPDGRHPVIDAMYGGPHVTNAPVGYLDATATANPVSRSSLAQLGFVVVTIDARGTPGRSKAFHDSSFLTASDTQLDDHVAAIRQLADRYTGMDLGRVGIYGHSFGGYSSTRALLLHPDFYKVGVSSAGSHGFQGMYGGAIHGMDRLVGGRPVYADGHAVRPDADAVPALFAPLDNSELADRLAGKLMLAYGDLDEHAMPALTLQLARALTRANKDYDLLYLPNQDHEFFRNDVYFMRRLWDYFVENLMDATPPRYRIAPPAT
ncbi:DPP IV N-terminal domain-containing protein [Stenotrophomonas sp. MMGLT7]|uniref:S9 family peptidase n=1 Tax=Stenotrophomonas sp. MMGLT7 TaxID=2901227 RepID=UPI001E4EC8BB|nr:DPP IV N-terminal domain-containing protein [Stenotrophomonas sp. MMGLT7]MCD7098560.1 S9 family peptidase [Stenotrophomonas sp. MMGLT7]